MELASDARFCHVEDVARGNGFLEVPERGKALPRFWGVTVPLVPTPNVRWRVRTNANAATVAGRLCHHSVMNFVSVRPFGAARLEFASAMEMRWDGN